MQGRRQERKIYHVNLMKWHVHVMPSQPLTQAASLALDLERAMEELEDTEQTEYPKEVDRHGPSDKQFFSLEVGSTQSQNGM